MADERDYHVETVSTRSPAPIAHAVRGMEFPCSRDDLLQQARDNGAREEVLEQIEHMPDSEYQSMADVFAGVGEANREEGGYADEEEGRDEDDEGDDDDDDDDEDD